MSSAKLAHPQQFPAPCSFLYSAIQTHTHVGGMGIGVQYPATDAARLRRIGRERQQKPRAFTSTPAGPACSTAPG